MKQSHVFKIVAFVVLLNASYTLVREFETISSWVSLNLRNAVEVHSLVVYSEMESDDDNTAINFPLDADFNAKGALDEMNESGSVKNTANINVSKELTAQIQADEGHDGNASFTSTQKQEEITVQQTSRQESDEEKPNPFRSVPPEPIPLMDKEIRLTNSMPDASQSTSYTTSSSFTKMTRNRHSCIRSIRRRHFSELLPHFHLYKQDDRNNSKLSFLLVDPAYHSNVGDHMLTLGEIAFLMRLQQQYKNEPKLLIDQCDYNQGQNFIPPCHKITQSPTVDQNFKKIALWNAGGNWGNLWIFIQSKRVNSFKPLLAAGFNKIISMPQSLFYTSLSNTKDKKDPIKDSANDAIRIARNIALGFELLSEHEAETMKLIDLISLLQNVSYVKERIVFTWREHYSFDRAKELYPFATNILVPDIAFQLGPYNSTKYRNQESLSSLSKADKNLEVDIVFFLRDDYESVYASQRNTESIREIMESKSNQKLTFSIVDWNSRLKMYNTNDYFFTDTAIQMLACGKVVITDRLHGSILSYLSGVPFVYLDNVSKKLNQTLAVAFEGSEDCEDSEQGMYAMATNLPEAVELAINLFAKYNDGPIASNTHDVS